MSFEINKALAFKIKQDVEKFFLEDFKTNPELFDPIISERVGSLECRYRIKNDNNDIILILSLEYGPNPEFGVYYRDFSKSKLNLVFSLISEYGSLEDFDVFKTFDEFGDLESYNIVWDSSEEDFTRKQIENFKDHESISSKIIDSIILD